jgi:pimeloyl-ACP methyl ester carboxylesterase
MKTILLPGFSIQNKDWAEELRSQIGEKSGLEIHYWPHWQTGQTVEGWKEVEIEKLLENVGSDRINIICKSIGTLVAVMAINKRLGLVNKIILCGIPIYDLRPGDDVFYQILGKLAADKVLVIQNERDNHGSFEDVKKMVKGINPEIRVKSGPREDHHYPYSEDFEEFLR